MIRGLSARPLVLTLLLAGIVLGQGCRQARTDGNYIIVAMQDPAINLDPRVGTDAASVPTRGSRLIAGSCIATTM